MKFRCLKCLSKLLAKNPDDAEKALVDACFTPKTTKIDYDKFKMENKRKMKLMKVVACPVCKSTDLELASY